MKKFAFKLSNINNTFKSILIYTLTPCLVMIILSFLFLISNIKTQINTYAEQSTNEIEIHYQAIEYKIKAVLSAFNLYNSDKELLIALKDDQNSTASINKIQNVINSLSSSIPYIESISVYNKANNTIITKGEVLSASEYFSEYSYYDYSPDYWYHYKFSISKPRYLPPTAVTAGDEQKLIVPLVYSRLGKNYLNKLIIFNIDFGSILSDEKINSTYADSTIGIVNRLAKKWYSPTHGNNPQKLSDELISIFKKNNTYNGIHNVNGIRSLVIYNSPTRSALGYSYFTAIPYASVCLKAAYPTTLLIFLIFLSSIIAIILAYIFSKRTYAPIKQLEETLVPDSDNNNTFETINKSIEQIKQKSITIEEQYKNSLSKIQNMYLINLLNTDNENISTEISSYFEFKYDYFCAIIYQIVPKDSLKNEYDVYSYEKLIQKFFICILEEYSSLFSTFTLPSEKNIFYILLNVESTEYFDKINDVAISINKILTEDKELIDINYSIGGVYEGIAGLKKSHNAALFNVEKHIDAAQENKAMLNITNRKKKNHHTFDLNKESQLTSYLTSFKSKLGRDYIEDIINENLTRNLSQSQLAKMYVQIITTITKVLDSKKIEHCILENESVLDSMSELLAMPLVELHSITFKLMDVFDLYVSNRSSNLDIIEITKYIDENYTTDIGLDSMSVLFNTSSTYLSQLIKNKLGVNFTGYLTKIRINRAIEIMKSGNITINEIFSQVGFNNRNAFTKAFKRVTGTTPSEYKKNNLK